MKLVKLQDNTSRQLSSIELLLATVYGSGIPVKFVPGNEYKVGDKVYTQLDDGSTIILECLKDGVYTDVIDNPNWKSFAVASDNGGSNCTCNPNNYKAFVPGEYDKGDIQYVADDETGKLTVYECVVPGHYDSITEDGWDIKLFIPGDRDNNSIMIETILNGKKVSEYTEGTTYGPGEVVYVVDETIGSITLYENTSFDSTTNKPPVLPWTNVNTTQFIDSTKNIIEFATDADIMEMFNANKLPTGSPDDDDEDVDWEEF